MNIFINYKHKMATFTSSLPDSLLDQLAVMAAQYKIPKNKLIENALTVYLDQLNRAEYVKSYRQAGKDDDVMQVAEEGMTYYLQDLESDLL